MSKLSNIIQRRDLEPLFVKALKITKHYKKAVNCSAMVMGPDCEASHFAHLCRNCKTPSKQQEANAVPAGCAASAGCAAGKTCFLMHMNAINEARRLGGSYVYMCQEGYVFWTSPFFSGERFAGALLSGGIEGSEKTNRKVKALAQILLLCAEQISDMSFIQKNVTTKLSHKPEYNCAECNSKNCESAAEVNEKMSNNTYPIDMERMLLASLRRGDNIEAKKILMDLLKILQNETKGNITVFRLKAMELAVLLSRAAISPNDIKDNAALDANNRYLKKIEESASLEEISGILCGLIDRMSGNIFSFQGVRHFAALRKAERYIWTHYTRKLSLQEIAVASGLSAPYFSTIFKEEMGENLSSYLNRLRVEKAAAMLATTNVSISGIAAACGFEDQSWFSKIFKNNTGLTPGKYRERGITADGSILG
ncbi:MAG: AraC family transcriptional regulator [Treponema sp.]|jgi:AraC-like DNA-binding protein|nr:AraC family transcriptional regulator [Treponema sp.]